jgi:hypothetical protein
VTAERSGGRQLRRTTVVVFENLSPEDRASAASAACQFLLRNEYVSLQQAADMRGISMQDLWNDIMADAGLPVSDLPVFAFAR